MGTIGIKERGSLLRGLRQVVTAVPWLLLVWQERWREREHLAGLDDRMLRDLGLTRSEVYKEIQKPVWRD
ncbi:MAG: DUF1127 domain-containing protein [Pseudomonadota bacterium]